MSASRGSGAGRWGLSLPWWSLALGAVTTVGLVGLAVVAFALHVVTDAIGYGLDLGPVEPALGDHYELALAVGIGTNIFGSLALSRLALRTRAATWPPVLAAVPVAVVTGLTATAAMLATLDVDPQMLLELVR